MTKKINIKIDQFICFFLFVSLIFTAAGVESASAHQEQAQEPVLGVVSMVDVDVNWYAKTEAYAKEIVKAAKAAKLKGGYGVYTSDWDFLIYRPTPDFAAAGSSLEKAVAGTPGEQILTEAVAKLYGLHSSEESEIVQFLPALSYFPTGAPATESTKYVDVQEHWLIGSDGKEYVSLVKKAGDFFESIDYPVEVQAYRSRIGESRVIFVFHFNNKGDYHARYAPEVLVQNYPEFREIVNGMMAYIDDFESRVWTFRPDLSYLPE